jgi:DNA repair protein RadC
MFCDPTCEMPRERLLHLGGERLTNPELLALLLGTGTRGRSATTLARDILGTVGGLAALSRAAPRELVTTSGVGTARATRIAAAFHLGRRAAELTQPPVSGVCSAEDVFRRLRPRMVGLSQEILIVLALDNRNVVLDEVEVARGSLNGVQVHPREVFRPLIRMAAASAILAHNHPSGHPEPSPEDVAITTRLCEVGDIVGIPILDHVVIGGGDYVSIARKLRESK